jgi:hypothetical protein
MVIKAAFGAEFRSGGKCLQTFIRGDAVACTCVYGITAISARWRVFLWEVNRFGNVTEA